MQWHYFLSSVRGTVCESEVPRWTHNTASAYSEVFYPMTRTPNFSRIFAVDLIEHLENAGLGLLSASCSETGWNAYSNAPQNRNSSIAAKLVFNDVIHVWTYAGTAFSGVLTMQRFKDSICLDRNPTTYSTKAVVETNRQSCGYFDFSSIKAATRKN